MKACRWSKILLPILVLILVQFGSHLARAGGPIESGETHSGSNTVSQPEFWTFEGTAGARLLIDVDKTGGASDYNTEICLIDPDQLDEVPCQRKDLVDHVLLKTGTYTIVVQDHNLNQDGTYNMTLLNLTAGALTSAADPDGGPIASGETLSGSNVASDMDAYQFYGTAGARVLIDVDKTGGASDYNTEICLIDPDQLDEVPCQRKDLVDHVLLKTGTYMIVVQDHNLNQDGTYNITLLELPGVVSSPSDCDGGMIAPGETLSGSNVASDMDAYQFYGHAGDQVLIDVDKTGGASHYNTEICLIDPDQLDEVPCQTEDSLDHILLNTGLYTIRVQDSGLKHAGSYNVTLNKLPSTQLPGIYNPSPENAGCGQSTSLTLTWDKVTGATGYGVFFGADVVEPLVKTCEDVPDPSCDVTGLDKNRVYYWKVLAYTSTGEVSGPVNWFMTHFYGDFDMDCDVDESDLAVFAADFGRTDCCEADVPPCEGDFDGDCDVDGSDLAVFAADFGKAGICP